MNYCQLQRIKLTQMQQLLTQQQDAQVKHIAMLESQQQAQVEVIQRVEEREKSLQATQVRAIYAIYTYQYAAELTFSLDGVGLSGCHGERGCT